MIISRTPLRISFFGGGTDYPIWYNVNGGCVISATINKYNYIVAALPNVGCSAATDKVPVTTVKTIPQASK